MLGIIYSGIVTGSELGFVFTADSPLWPGFDHRKISDYKWRIDKSWSLGFLK